MWLNTTLREWGNIRIHDELMEKGGRMLPRMPQRRNGKNANIRDEFGVKCDRVYPTNVEESRSIHGKLWPNATQQD